MTNTQLQTMITALGDRICAIVFDNAYRILIGYPGSDCKKVTDLILTSEYGEDMIGVPSVSKLGGDQKLGVSYVTYHVTSCIQEIIVMDTGFETYRVDPMHIS